MSAFLVCQETPFSFKLPSLVSITTSNIASKASYRCSHHGSNSMSSLSSATAKHLMNAVPYTNIIFEKQGIQGTAEKFKDATYASVLVPSIIAHTDPKKVENTYGWKNWHILPTGCWHTQHHTKTTSASLRFINLPKKHVSRKPNASYYSTMPIKQTISIHSLNTKRGSILMEDSGLTLNDKGEVVCTSGLYPSSSGTVVTAALLALADSSNKDRYLPTIHAPPGPCTNRFSGNKAPTKTKIAAERKAAKEVKQKEAEGKKAAVAACKANSLAKKQEKRISSAKAKASTVTAKAETLCSKLANVMKSAAIPEAVHLHKKSKGMLGTAPTNTPLTHTLPFFPQM
jgi:hypothetical protein